MDHGESVSPALLVLDPTRAASRIFRLFTTASALLRFADGLNGFCWNWPEGLSEEHSDLISALFGILGDWMNASGGQDSIQAGPEISWTLDEHIKQLAKGGFVIGARERFFLLGGGTDAKELSWRIVDIKVQPAALVRVAVAAANGCSGQRAPLPSAGMLPPGQDR
jgi:hypothetical protein